ncbi:hydroxyacylglutathione hydrolase [Iodidimonas nitroreducens]|uniref:Hydroxyacylglutathione hydrolase n=1 Tax=Iodidimonas nitroreducens TaxID=1236968 RepID=A0A5A7N6H6_9PROT|nr:hydroxyacylglutathione hydrolase [Iodidimonas nitroreducens]GAK32167.1 hydroxyacylglutathione hydrolase [alpha proteobacterium Q-1]GER02679.1 hydroxyacylglutathione hydrolase [Iodidimonas nitroreducens]
MAEFAIELVFIEQPLANYVYLLRENQSGHVAVVDPGWAAPVIKALEKRGWTPDVILLTHHHADHIGATKELKDRYQARVIAPDAERHRIPHADEWVREGESVHIGEARGEVIALPGHTLGHVAYHFPKEKALFCGDTLFSLGCGRLFEGTAAQMWQSLSKLAALPDETLMCCAHEYTEANGRFALTIEPGNKALHTRMNEVKALRLEGQPTVPSNIGIERATNPFLRPHSPEIRAHFGMESANDAEIFGAIRKAKDSF